VGVQETRWDKGGLVNAGGYIWGRGEMYAEFWWRNLRKRAHLEDRRRWEDLQEVGWGA